MNEKPKNIVEGEFTDIPNEPLAVKNPESGALNSKGHERMAKVGRVLKFGSEKILKGAGKVAGGAVKLFKWGAKGVKEGAAGVLSIDDIAKRGAVKVGEAATQVKDAAVTKTRESLTSARAGVVDAYHTTKEKGAAVISKGKEKVQAVSDKYLSWKLEIAMKNIRMLEEKRAKINERISEHKELMASLLGLSA